MNQEKGWAKRIAAECTDCGRCAESCRILTELNESPGQIARRGIEMDEAYGCALCGKCEAMCPRGLSPWRMFEQRRVEAVKQGEITIEEYQYLFPDRAVTVMSIFREYYGIDYSDLNTCCGSSGQLGHFRPEWAAEHEVQNLEEAGKAGAGTLLAYCHACVLNFGNIADSKIKVHHALNTLLGFEEDYSEIKDKAAQMFEGEKGYELYLKLFQE